MSGSGQLSPDLQAGLARRYSAVKLGECRFLHTIEMLDGQIIAGETDLRGFEEAFLGGERFWGQRVVEIAPASAWLSAYVAPRAGDYVALELAAGLEDGAGWEQLRRSWWFVMGGLGLEAPVVYAERDQLPDDLGTFDVALLPCVLSRCADPLLVLRRAAELSDDTVVVTEPVDPQLDGLYDETGSALAALLPPPRLPAGPRWALSASLLGRLLDQSGFSHQVVTHHEPRRMGQTGRYVTIVARRPVPRARKPAVERDAGPLAGQHPPEAAQPGVPNRAALPVAPGDLPLPGPVERRLAGGAEDAEAFLALGSAAFMAMQGALQRAGADLPGLGRVLDFGCGVSRVLRHWRAVPGVEMHGTDVNVAAILWNRERLGYGAFAMNTLDPKLGYPDGYFGLVYAIGVFNHLPETIQLRWVRELLRVVRPGGFVYLTTFAAAQAALLSPELRRAMDAGEIVVSGAEQAGSDDCMAFHSPEWVVRELLMPSGAALADYSPAGLDHPPQDCWLLRKPR